MEKLETITESQWDAVCDFNKRILSSFINDSVELSQQTKKIYNSNLKIWFIWVQKNLNNKKQIDIKPLEYKRFQNWLVNRGCSSADVNNKRAAISSLNGYLEIYYSEDYPLFRNFINKTIKRPQKAFVHDKEPLSSDEFEHLIDVLTAREEWQKIAYLLFTFDAGCRRAESAQVIKNVVNCEPETKSKTIINECGDKCVENIRLYHTNIIRCKGGKMRRLPFGERTLKAFNKWLEIRGTDNCPAMFISHYGGEIRPVSLTCFNAWARSTFEPIVGRRFHPHLIRCSRASQAVMESGQDIHAVQKLLGHSSSQTTEIYVIRPDNEGIDDLF